jgi:hypothetical protein
LGAMPRRLDARKRARVCLSGRRLLDRGIGPTGFGRAVRPCRISPTCLCASFGCPAHEERIDVTHQSGPIVKFRGVAGVLR